MTFHLEYKDKKFSLITEEKLPTTTKLQIKFFGFNPKDESNFNFESKKKDINIEELIKFFKDVLPALPVIPITSTNIKLLLMVWLLILL